MIDRREVMMYKLILSFILGGLVVLFIIQSVAVVEIQVLFWTLTISKALLMFLILVIGFLMGWFLHGYLLRTKQN